MRKVYRLQAIGGSYYIALPKEWLKRFGLGKGSHVEITIEADGSLRIKPIEELERAEVEEARSRVSVEVRDRETVYTLLVWLYLGGYDVITIRFRDSAMGSAIRNAINRAKNILLGFEIVDEDSTSIALQVLASSDTDVYTILKNMNRIARSMYLDAITALVERDLEKAYEVEARDQDLNRLYFYITRAIRKKVASNLEPGEVLKLVDLRMIARSIEEIGDDAKRAAKIVQEVIINDIALDSTLVDSVRVYVDELDAVYRGIMVRIERSSPLSELIDALHRCEKIVQKLSNLRRDTAGAGTKGASYISELAYTYEGIAMHIYDIISLVPVTVSDIESPRI